MQLLAFGPLQAGAAVLVALLVLQPPFVMNKEDGYETISMVRRGVDLALDGRRLGRAQSPQHALKKYRHTTKTK